MFKTTTVLISFVLITSTNSINAQTAALQFDGVNDHVVMQHDNAYDVGFGNFTF
ncbi:MAG: hypothetical protein QNL61_00735 [Crocinitomicaceae bacterium]